MLNCNQHSKKIVHIGQKGVSKQMKGAVISKNFSRFAGGAGEGAGVSSRMQETW